MLRSLFAFKKWRSVKTQTFDPALLCEQLNDPAQLTELARDLQSKGSFAEAIKSFQRVVELAPDMPLAHYNLGVCLCEAGRLEESFTAFKVHAGLTYKVEQGHALKTSLKQSHKAFHDQEQKQYLADVGRWGDEGTFLIEDCDRLAGRALNTKCSAEDCTAWTQDNHPHILIIDNFLTQDALQRLQRFCWGSTIWRQSYEAGYLGAMPEHGIGSPLLAQIAEELRADYPSLFSTHVLRHFWGFKYDSQYSGIALHADAAAVNVNFWITPDQANLGGQKGGMVIWDKSAPLDWDFLKYNDNVQASRDFLACSGARATTIPYKCNRAIIFNSRYFHESDKFVFREGYLNRRINITLLFGDPKSAL